LSTDTANTSTSAEAEAAPETLTPDADSGALREAQARRVRLRRMLALATVASTIVLGAIGWWTHLEVETSMRATRGAALKSVLDSEAQSLRVCEGFAGLSRDRRRPDTVQQLRGRLTWDTCSAPSLPWYR